MTVLIKAAIGVMQLFYELFKLFPVRKKIVFISRQADEPSLDFRLLADDIKRSHPDYEIVMLCRMLNSGIMSKISYAFHILRQEYHMATSKALILDSYCIAASVLTHRKSLLVIQMWHSVGTMKKFGYSILDKPEGSSSRIAHLMKMHHGYSYVLCAGEGYRDHLAQGFNVDPSIIKIFPLPRVELLQDRDHIDKKRKEIFTAYPELDNGKKNIVYVPTFRKADDEDFDDALHKLDQALDHEKYNLIVKAHPLSVYHGQKFSTAGNFLICDEFTSMDMLLVADAVISDYSCIIYEAAVLMKPLFFYTYDYDSYMSTRDIYMDYKKEIPGPMEGDAAALAKAIDGMESYDYDRLSAFLHKYVHTTGRETEDITEFIFSHIDK
ncbi:MAG: CDP-glycerol glycerophosphotransferase family protein [Eubacterium sp.]|nr:CDP-glycerol glycerophosphotransferase family protein [Eubacterium sp.]